MQTTIYLIRHGEVHNPEGIIYGRLPNFGLSDKGKQELEKTADFLKDKTISQLYSSPLLRTKQSAEIIKNKLGIEEIQYSDLLIETGTSYEGRKFNSLDALQSDVYLKPLDPSDETIEQLAHRMQNFLNKLLATNNGKHIAVVSHGDPIMALKAVIKRTPLEFLPFKTDHYVQHGEVYEINENVGNLSIKQVFKPQ
ncbi:MAG TPA: histidine phosphatase family protein [Candidatus Acidoferrales bacterium]|nr:histidine phosphatase family protein [Candidatus Acidoferrales bacterium]